MKQLTEVLRYIVLGVVVKSIVFHLNLSYQTPSFRRQSRSWKNKNVQSVAENFKEDTSKTKSMIILIGERHSGTKWLTSQLVECFGDRMNILDRFTRWKHWFQYEDKALYPPNSTVVVAIFRDPYDWVDAMRKKPYHSPNHFDLDWKTFVTRPWSMERGPADLKLTNERSTHNVTCMHRFSFNKVIPCSIQDRNMYNGTSERKKVGVTYELNQDGSGKAYDSILQLRRDKIENFLNVSNFDAVHSFYPVQYEYLIMRGTTELINELERVTGHRASCKGAKPQRLRPKVYDHNYIQWMDEHLDWSTEKLIGYTRRMVSG